MSSLDRLQTLISDNVLLDGEDFEYNEEEEEEEEDVDFNPLLKDTPSREPSSSLCSDVEPLDGEIVNSLQGKEQTTIHTNNVSCVESIPHASHSNSQRESSVSEKGSDFVREEEISTVEAIEKGDMIRTHKQVLLFSEEEDDAICKRTRAKYSLESFTLDDLEAFLQETDDEDDIANVDDDEEYRKFLAAVLQGGVGQGEVQLIQSGNNDDDDNDLDFEIELEEALETDDEEIIPEKVTTDDNNSSKRRPVTRQKRRQNISIQQDTDSPEQANRLLRPLVPILPIAQPLGSFYAVEAVAPSEDSPICGFSQAQMGELHCLIHDHMQLLIQVYSLCALDHSRQNIGTQVQGLISEMIQQHKGNQNHLLFTGSTSPAMDVSDLAGGYLVDVSSAVEEYRRCQVESGFDALSQRVPLFPLPQQEVSSALSTSKSPSDQRQAKKRVAATLVESAKNQSVALVHKNIAKLAKRFLPLFKVSLYPYKPPAAAISNRILFTEGEDELLALGIMEYNSDWKAIKQRFLPCKGEHQIYVRQKNRRSSKAPENPIKAVFRMKSSPLNPEEIGRIQEGLKYFKHDWMSVWKFVVPHRDPSSLPRQWRTALGIQKSYKRDGVKKEKRRLYDRKRKFIEQSHSAKEDHPGTSKDNENQVGDEVVDNTGEAYLHEGFLTDWRPGKPTLLYSTTCDRYGSVQTHTGEGSKNPQLCGPQVLTYTRRIAPSFIPLYNHTSGTAPSASREPIVMRPYRGRKLYKQSVVRIAPDLPPVNLPSSVRVISQSVFAKNRPETSSNTCMIKGTVSDVSERGDLGTDGENNGPSGEKVVNLQEDVPAESSSEMVQMHPLLFRTPEHGQVTCYPVNKDPGGSNTFSFFSDNRPQLLSLFNSPRQLNHSADQLQKKSSLDETAQGDSCFHPLLQRSEYETSYVSSGRGNLDPDIGKKDKSCQLHNTSSSVEKTSTPGSGRNVVSSKPSSKHSKHVNLEDVSEANILKVTDICVIHRNDGSEVPRSSAPSDASRCIDEMADQSNLGIVMEQEELSDSDEEMVEEEHVEFECEEMADSDSEDEGSDCDEIIEMQDEDNRSAVDETASTYVDPGKELGSDSPNSPWLSLDPSSSRLSSKFKDREKTEPASQTTIERKKRPPMKNRDTESKVDAGVGRLRLGPLVFPSVKKSKKCAGQAETSRSIETTEKLLDPKTND
ncbi:unnamed protein product [Cochlearia groenlandica]